MKIHYTTQFKKDYKRIQKQKKDISKLRVVIEKLSTEQLLEPKYKDHQLSGNWEEHRDCHIEPDLLLIYRIASDDLYLERTGSHPNYSKSKFQERTSSSPAAQ